MINCNNNCTNGCKSLQNTKVLNFAHFTPKNTNISACKNEQIYKIATITVHMHGYCSCANEFFFSLSPFILLFSSVFFSQQNHKITFTPASTSDPYLLPTKKITKPSLPSLNHRSRQYHPNTKTQKLKLAITHHNTKNPKTKTSNNPSQNQPEPNEIKLQNLPKPR